MNVYDFDKTIYDGDSSVDFYLFILKKKPYLIYLLFFQLYTMFKYCLKLINKEEFKESFFVFIKKIDNIDNYILEFWNRNDKKIKKWYLKIKKSDDLIISASPEFLLKTICEKLNIKYLIASKIDKKTGKFNGLNCYGKEKLNRFNEKFKNITISEFYSDSLSDKSLMEIANKAYIIKNNKIIKYQIYEESKLKKMKNFFINQTFFTFVFCGGIGTLTNFIISLFSSMYINDTFAYIIGYSFSIFVTYYLNIKINFYRKSSIEEFTKFVISYIPNFIILFSFVAIFLNILNVNKIIVYAIAGILGIPTTFILVKLFAFIKETKNEK